MQDKFSLANRDFSFWEKEILRERCDFIIVGAGLVGLSTALSIRAKYPKSKILILDRSAIPYGASTRNAGFACFGSISELIDDLKFSTEDEVGALIESRWRGLQLLRQRVGDQNLAYSSYGGYELFKEDSEEANIYFERIEDLNNLVKKSTGLKECFRIIDNKFGFNCNDQLIFNQHEGQLNPGLMMSHLKQLVLQKKINIINGINITHYQSDTNDVKLYADQGIELCCAKLLITTNAFTPQLHKGLDLKPGRNQVLMTKPIQNLKVKGCFHYDKGYVYFRNYQSRLLIGGGRNIDIENETTDQFAITEKIQTYLRDLLHNIILPNTAFEEDTWWSGIIATGSTKKPIVKSLDPNVYAGVRLGGMGVALGSLVGQQLADLV